MMTKLQSAYSTQQHFQEHIKKRHTYTHQIIQFSKLDWEMSWIFREKKIKTNSLFFSFKKSYKI